MVFGWALHASTILEVKLPMNSPQNQKEVILLENLTWIPKIKVWKKRYFLSTMVFFGQLCNDLSW